MNNQRTITVCKFTNNNKQIEFAHIYFNNPLNIFLISQMIEMLVIQVEIKRKRLFKYRTHINSPFEYVYTRMNAI